MSCIDHLGVDKDKDEDMFKITCYVPWLIHENSDVRFMFTNMVEYIYMFVPSATA